MSLSQCQIRRNCITATDMAVLFGLNPYESPAKILEKKINPVEVSNNHVRRGKLKEPSVLEAFLLDLNIRTTRHEGPTIKHPTARISATPDAYVEGTRNVVECKSISSTSFSKWYKAIPTYYQIQVFTQMLIADSEYGYIGALEEGDPSTCEYRFAAWKVFRDPDIEALMLKEVERFWTSVEEGKLYRVISSNKKFVQERLSSACSLIYPDASVIEEVKSNDEDLSKILALFD